MPVYLFELPDGQILSDAGGAPCTALTEAKLIADAIALHLIDVEPEIIGRGLFVSVKAEDGDQVYRASLDAIARLHLAH